VNGTRDRARRKRRRRPLDGSKPAKGMNPTSAAGCEKTQSSKAALSAAGSGTPRGKENAAVHDPNADDEPADAPLAWQVKPPVNRSDPRTCADVGRLLRIDQWRLDSLTGLTTPCASRPPIERLAPSSKRKPRRAGALLSHHTPAAHPSDDSGKPQGRRNVEAGSSASWHLRSARRGRMC
jgi:hypothetical protein